MTISERLERLERQNRWMRRTGAVGIAVVAVLLLFGQGKKELTLVDSVGKPRITLTTSPAPSLLFSDKEGRCLLRLGLTKAGDAILGMNEPSGPDVAETRFRLGTGQDGTVGLTVYGAGYPRASFGIDRDERPSVQLLEQDGKVIWKAPGE